jgi:hypothetical protein
LRFHRTSRAPSSSGWSAPPRSTSRRAISIRWSCRSDSNRRSVPTRSRRIARCGMSTRRLTCISSASARDRSSARHPRCWCAPRAVISRRTRLPEHARAGGQRTRIRGSQTN